MIEIAPTISVVLVTWNSADVILDCLDALHTNPPSAAWDVAVVDNGSSDATVAATRERFPAIQVIANRTNRGLPAANNQGIAATKGDYLLIANPDTLVSPGAVDALAEILNREPRAAIAIPRLIYEDGSLQTSAGDLPTLREALFGRQLQRRKPGVASGFWWDGWPHDEEREIGRGHEACYLVRRCAIAEVGLQDEQFVLDWEGIEWSARMRDACWQIWLCPGAVVTHLGGASIRKAQTRWIISSHRGMYRYFRARVPLIARPFVCIAVALRGIAKLAGAMAHLTDYQRGHDAHTFNRMQ